LQADILRPHTGVVLDTLDYAAETFIPTFRHSLIDLLLQTGLAKEKNAFFAPKPIELFLKEAVHPISLRNGIELWVTVFPCVNILGLGCDRLIDLVRAKTGTDVDWLCAQDCPDDETLYNLLLASAAIPFAFPPRQVNGKWYIDGGLADNVPLHALAAKGCSYVIIIHLDNGVVWNRHDFPEQTVIEIRPEKPINKSNTPIVGTLDTFFDFSAECIAELKQRGYKDARRCLQLPILVY
jgi:NTE family protein